MKLLGDGFPWTGVAEGFQFFHVVHLRRKPLQKWPLHIFFGNRVLDDNRVAAHLGELVPNFWRDRIVRCQPVDLGKCPQRFLRVFAGLAVDLSGRKKSPRQQDLSFYDDRIDLFLDIRLFGVRRGAIFRVVDLRGIDGGCRWKDQPAQKNRGQQAADHQLASSKSSHR